jgi:flavin-dependent dehydrogenase
MGRSDAVPNHGAGPGYVASRDVVRHGVTGAPLSERLCRHSPVVIAGAGYAGLAAAAVLGPRALLIDPHEPGAIQHSACATPLEVVAQAGAAEAVIQSYASATVHTPHGDTTFVLRAPYCIFDHERLCRLLFEASGSRFLRARVLDFDGTCVRTSAGTVRGDLYIDATGWRGALVTARRPELRQPARLASGIEADIAGRGEGLHFYADASLAPGGYAWVFPAAGTLRIGVLGYRQKPALKASLARFLTALGHSGRPCRGGLIPWFSRPGVVDGILVAGDAAGHCLPTTAEGIRFAFHFGRLAGRIARAITDGQLDRTEGFGHYLDATRRHGRRVARLRMVQHLKSAAPDLATHAWVRSLATPLLSGPFLRAYDRTGEAHAGV